MKKALGLEFGVDKWEQVVAHLDKLIALWDRSVSNELPLSNNFDLAIHKVYDFLASRSIINQHGNWLK
ncbi:hypothetical protein, partial [Chamaesiphon sp. OTE_75_metabat_556]|uniref:hypothetical protein n=1 Tax=Chamaesiphon sp. OTE_75_metabat_556 TaxID=2964692 RepID=UPI00286CA73C